MNLERVLGSRNRVRVLRSLFQQDGVSGRAAAAQTGISPSAAKATLEELVASGLVLRSEDRGRACHEINRSHRLTPALERLFGEEKRLADRLPAAVRAGLRTLTPPPELRCVGVSRDGEATLALSPLAPRSVVEAAVGGLLRFEYGLRLVGVVADPRRIPPEDRLWSIPGAPEAPPLEADERARALRFFGISPSEGPAGSR